MCVCEWMCERVCTGRMVIYLKQQCTGKYCMVFEEARWKTAILRKQQKLIFFVAVTVILTTTIHCSNSSNLDNKQNNIFKKYERVYLDMYEEWNVCLLICIYIMTFYVVKSYLSNRNWGFEKFYILYFEVYVKNLCLHTLLKYSMKHLIV